ncbi:MAG: hypothetical protein IKY01_14730 [Prevotella sp.]|nr:hypothetical protein [Prevotella sp.]
MNIKLHTPKSLKTGSGMASLKQFLLSLFATSVSIALTFGTAAIIDYNAKQKSKREIVMMVMYDMYNSLQSIQKADSTIQQAMDLQLQIAEDTTKFETQRYIFAQLMPKAEYTETTERIFSSSIETINTVGNVLFTENVAEFYQMRKFYKTTVCDSIANDIVRSKPFSSLKNLFNFEYSFYTIMSSGYLRDMQRKYAQCKQMMEVTDADIDAYREQRAQIDKSMTDDDASDDSLKNRFIEIQSAIEAAKAKLKLE